MPQIELVSRESLSKEKWWGKLEASEQRSVLLETQALTEELVKHEMSRLGMGKHLKNLRSVLEPKKIFVKYVKSRYGDQFSIATAYRWIEIYENTEDKVPDVVLSTAIAHGYDVISTGMMEKMKTIPQPKTQDRVKIVHYLEKVKAAQKASETEERSVTAFPEYDLEVMKKELINFAGLRYDRLPQAPKVRQKWATEVIGMLLSRFNMKATEFNPIEVPEGFRVVRGRPKSAA